MQKEKWYTILWQFLKQYRSNGLMFLLYTLIFAAVFSLYDLQAEAVLYAAVLCLLMTAVVLAVSFYYYNKRHEERRKVLQNAALLLDSLPEPKNIVEEDYHALLMELKQLYDNSLIEWQNERRESMDYYTAWMHQAKTPISVMQMMLQGEDTDEYRVLTVELFRIEQYVEMALSYLRLGNGASDFVFGEYSLDAVIKQAVHKYAPQFVRKRIRLSYEPTTVVVLTDEKWLLFIVEQLLSNAVKYNGHSKEVPACISITVEGKVLKIADNGIGIAPEDIPRIFEKGFTGYNGRADKKSTGLGLYLCHLAAEKLSHTISVESRVGVGTVFTVDMRVEELEVE